MKNKINGYTDLRDVPNEIIIGAFSIVRGDYYAGVDELLLGGKLLLDEFKLIANPNCLAIIEEKIKEIVDQTAKEVYNLAEKHSVITHEYIEAHKKLVESAKHKVRELGNKRKVHLKFYDQINELLKRESWLKEKKPMLTRENLQTVIINEGNAVYVKHQNVDHDLNVLYSETSHKRLVDNLINEIYASCENLGASNSETTTENE